MRAPQDEEEGVNTYSALWGVRRAVIVWLGVMTATGAFAVVAAARIDFLLPVLVVLSLLLLGAVLCGIRLLKRRTTGKTIEGHSGVWTLALYLSLGLIPLACRLWLPTS